MAWDELWGTPAGGPFVPTVAGIKGFPFVNDEGEAGILSGKSSVVPTRSIGIGRGWAARVHPYRDLWTYDEAKQRASFLGDRRHLADFLVPHRFEGTRVDPAALTRGRLAYGIGLNGAYLQEIFGHIRSTPTHYTWGVLGATGDQDILVEPKENTLASDFWWDATGDGTTWKNFFRGEVLEWMLTSPGCLILIDTNRSQETPFMTIRDAELQGIRAKCKLIPFSWVEDFGTGPFGYRWIKILEIFDARQPEMDDDEDGLEERHVIYELMPDGRTRIRRVDDEGKPVGPTTFQKIVDPKGRGILPFVEVTFGDHPDIPRLGTGLLMGLDDIVIDLFNLLTEVREAYRNSVFDFLTYRGEDMEGVQEQLEGGTRLVHLGSGPRDELNRVGSDAGEVTAGLNLMEQGIKNWALSAKRRASEIGQQIDQKSGVALKAEFQLDLVPLMVSITERLDSIETNAMFILAQMEGKSMEQANVLMVRSETAFQMEQEASRIARIVSEFLDSIPGMPATLLQKLIMRWAGSIDFLDMDEKIDGKSLREILEKEAEDIAKADTEARKRQNQLGILGAAAVGAATGGNRNGGGDPNTRRRDGTRLTPRPARPTTNGRSNP